MVNEESRQALAIVKARQKLNCTNPDVESISKNIGDSMRGIYKTQGKLQVRRVIEKFPVVRRAYNLSSRVIGQIIPSWDDLFEQQLSHVRNLNGSLVEVIYISSEHLKDKQEQLYSELDLTKEHLKGLNESKQKLPEVKTKYESSPLFETEFDANDVAHYDLLKEQLVAEDKVLTNVGEIALRGEVHHKNIDKIQFLERHIAFYRGVLFSAKKLALVTGTICEALGHLSGDSYHTKATGECLSKVHAGVSMLKGYTDDLRGLYQKTNNSIDALGRGTETDILRIGAQSLDSMVSQSYDRMIPNEPSNT